MAVVGERVFEDDKISKEVGANTVFTMVTRKISFVLHCHKRSFSTCSTIVDDLFQNCYYKFLRPMIILTKH